mgnify:CR=1 FL=1
MSDPSNWPYGQPISEMPMNAWPAADQRAMRPAASSRRSPFAAKRAAQGARDGPAAWRPATRKNVEKTYGKWICFLEVVEPDALAEPPANRMTEYRCAAFVDALVASGLAASSQAAHLYHLAMAAKVLAPRQDWTWLVEAGLRMRHAAEPVRDKRSRTVPAADLYALGISLMDASAEAERKQRATRRYRDGLILALWAARPWRLRTFVALDVDRHLHIQGNGAASVVFGGEDMKTTAAKEWPLPAHLVPYLQTYLAEFRPAFPGADTHTGLWPSMKGCPLGESALARALARQTQNAFGVVVHPHAVRYAAATSTALAGPQSAGTIMAVLGHANPDTAHEYYVMTKTIDAQRKAASTLCEMRQELSNKVP